MGQSTISRLRPKLVAIALAGTIAAAFAGFSGAANAVDGYGSAYIQQGPYHEDVLPGGVTGPLAPEANGG